MGAFKPASRPGSYGQQVAHVDNVSRLLKKQTRDRNDQIKNNKQLADTHRAYAKSFNAGIQTEAASRKNALEFDDYYRKIDQQFQMQAIEAAYESSMRNSRQQQEQTNKDTAAIVDLVGKALGTGVEVYKQREEAINKSQYNALENIRLTQGTSLADFQKIRGLERSILEDENTTDAVVQSYKDKGYTIEQLKTIAGTREGVFSLSLLNQFRSEISASQYTMFATDTQVAGFPEGTTASMLLEQGDVAGVMQAFNQHTQSIFRMAQEANGGNVLEMAAVQKQIDHARAGVMSKVSKVDQTQTAAKLKDEQLNHASNLTKFGGATAWAERWNKNPNLIHQDFKNLEYLATVTGSGVDSTFISELRKQVNPNTKRTYEQDYGVQLDRINDKIISERSQQWREHGLNQKDLTQSYILEIMQEGVFTAAGAELVLQNARDNGVEEEGIARIQKALNARIASNDAATLKADQDWGAIRRNNPHLVGFTEESIWQMAPSAKWAEKKINEMYTIQGRDPYLKDAKDYIESGLKERLKIHGKDQIADRTYVAARRHAIETYKRNRARLGIDGHKEALALFDKDLGPKEKSLDPNGLYSVPDASKDSTTRGFVNFQSDATGITEEAVTYAGAHTSINQVTNNSRNVGERLKAIGEIDTSYLTDNEIKQAIANYGNINAPVDPETWNQLEILKSAIGGANRPETMDLLTELANARGIEVQKFEQSTEAADQVIRDIQEKFGTNAAIQIKKGAPIKGEAHNNLTSTWGQGVVETYGPTEVTGDWVQLADHSGDNAHLDIKFETPEQNQWMYDYLELNGIVTTEVKGRGAGVTVAHSTAGPYTHAGGHGMDIPMDNRNGLKSGPIGTAEDKAFLSRVQGLIKRGSALYHKGLSPQAAHTGVYGNFMQSNANYRGNQ